MTYLAWTRTDCQSVVFASHLTRTLTGVYRRRKVAGGHWKSIAVSRTVMAPLHPDFKEFLRLLNAEGVQYLLIGGYAVAHYGYNRTTADMDIWIAIHPDTAQKMVTVLARFGMKAEELAPELFLQKGDMIRMGVPPVRIEILNDISGVTFAECYQRRETVEIDGVPVSVIHIDDLKRNKQASARYKDMDDLQNLNSLKPHFKSGESG